MLKKFANWFVAFGLSFLVSDVFGWTEQGKAFLYIYLGIDVVIFIVIAVIIAILGYVKREAVLGNAISFAVILVTAAILAVILFAT